MSDVLDDEVDRNFDAFQARLTTILPDHRGQFALLRGGNIVGYYPTSPAALAQGRAAFSDGRYSIQEVTDRPADLGFFSHAIHPRIA